MNKSKTIWDTGKWRGLANTSGAFETCPNSQISDTDTISSLVISSLE